MNPSHSSKSTVRLLRPPLRQLTQGTGRGEKLRLGARVSVGQRQAVQQRIDPKIVLSSHIFQLNQAELEQTIESELQENPALERVDGGEVAATREEILAIIAPDELKPSGSNYEAQRSMPKDGETTDWMDLAAGSESLWDHLIAQLKASVPTELYSLANYYVGSINDRGYLTVSVEEAALDCGSSLEDSELVFEALRECEPAGVGAANLKDCLILQLRQPSTDIEKLAKHILIKDWDELVARNSRAIMRRYKLSPEVVQEAFDVILNLNPFPGEAFRSSHAVHQSQKSFTASPDIRIGLSETGWVIEVPDPSYQSLQISRAYESRLEKLREKARENVDEKRHLTEYVDRAQRFLDALAQRRLQLINIGKYIIEKQAGFVQTGDYIYLASLTRSQMAKDLGVHESTISRATNNKFLQIATGEVVSFDVLFKPALRIQKMIEDIVARENPDSPYSDERIAEMLKEKGVDVARRTVNKYRDRSRQLSSRHRRSA